MIFSLLAETILTTVVLKKSIVCDSAVTKFVGCNTRGANSVILVTMLYSAIVVSRHNR